MRIGSRAASQPANSRRLIERRLSSGPGNRVLAQVALCSREYGCFTAQNVFLERGEAALPVSPKCNARCIGCISEQDDESGFPSPQARVADETTARELGAVALHHLERVDDGIVSFGQGCEGEPLLRSTAIARAIEIVRGKRSNGTINLNTNGSLPKALARCIDAGLDAVRVSLNSFRPARLRGVLPADRLRSRRRARIGATGVRARTARELESAHASGRYRRPRRDRGDGGVLRDSPVAMVQTRTLNIDPERYFGAVGRPKAPLGMRHAIEAMRRLTRVGNFTHTH